MMRRGGAPRKKFGHALPLRGRLRRPLVPCKNGRGGPGGPMTKESQPMPDAAPLRIAYLSDFSPLDREMYSGGNARIYDALRRHAGEVQLLSSHWHAAEPARRAILALPERYNMRLRWRAHLALAPLIARGLRRELVQSGADVLFCAYSLQSLAGLRVPPGMVCAFTSDATHMTYKRSRVGQAFGSYWSMSRRLDPWIERAEARALRRADLLLWPSDWLKEGADSLYNLPPGQARIVPWGANIDHDPPPGPAPVLSAEAPVELLFVGRDWFAKGGPVTVELLDLLRARGVAARLTVIGCTPPDEHMREGMRVHDLLDKGDPAQMATFEAAFRRAHFMVMASYESWGFAFCEAAAYGLPSLCLRIGGIPVREGVNGHPLPPEAGAPEMAEIIERYLAAPDRYAALCASTRREYETRLNWDAWGKRTARLLRAAVAQKRKAGQPAARAPQPASA